MKFLRAIGCLFIFIFCRTQAQLPYENNYDIQWNSESKNASESMPCGGGSIGLNVWVEKNDVLFYIAQSGCFDEYNALLKSGRIRLRLTPNPLSDEHFSQLLHLNDGSIYIHSNKDGFSANIHVWVEVFNPVIHIEVKSSKAVKVQAFYENWRYQTREIKGKENNENSYKFSPQGKVYTYKDSIAYEKNKILFYHRNRDSTVFDLTVKQQGLDSVENEMFNPLKNRTFGGYIEDVDMIAGNISSGEYCGTSFQSWSLESKKPLKETEITIGLCTAQTATLSQWKDSLNKIEITSLENKSSSWNKNIEWWKSFWQRSFIIIDPDHKNTSQAWPVGRNYQLFRYMLACNAYGDYPTKFNGGLFTYDPMIENPSMPFTPDFRNWGGGVMTQQNQRLVYYPMLESGDFDMMTSVFDFYLRLLHNAELRSAVYWHHKGACFTEQLENFGLPNASEYGWERPADFDLGVEYNKWLEYTWDTVLEFCDMMLKSYYYNKDDIAKYLPFIESCLTFFDEHYQYLSLQRGHETLDQSGHLILFPGSAGETYKMAYNPSSTIAALTTVLNELTSLPEELISSQEKYIWRKMMARIPPIPLKQFEGHTTIAPAITWQRINNVESMQLYPVFPWGIFGIGKSNFDIALNTWKYDTAVIKNKSSKGWKQDAIFAACLGQSEDAWHFTSEKLKDGTRRFPAFWGPGFDWTPDMNQGGSGMIALQKMLLQTDGKKIFLFPAWSSKRDVHFKLYAPEKTTVEAVLKNGKLQTLKVTPQEREKDVVNMLEK